MKEVAFLTKKSIQKAEGLDVGVELTIQLFRQGNVRNPNPQIPFVTLCGVTVFFG